MSRSALKSRRNGFGCKTRSRKDSVRVYGSGSDGKLWRRRIRLGDKLDLCQMESTFSPTACFSFSRWRCSRVKKIIMGLNGMWSDKQVIAMLHDKKQSNQRGVPVNGRRIFDIPAVNVMSNITFNPVLTSRCREKFDLSRNHIKKCKNVKNRVKKLCQASLSLSLPLSHFFVFV